MARDAGVLMHITSLPSPCGIGTLGREAYRFADFLKAAGQRYWQILPVGPTSYGDSPYQSFSTYAGNPYLIDLDLLQEEGLLEKEEYEALDWGGDPLRVDYEALYRSRFQVLRLAYERGASRDREEFERFRRDNESWLGNYALFMAVKEHFGMISWLEWPDEGIRLRRKRSLVQYEKRLKAQVEFWEYVQFLFFRQWRQLKAYVNSLGILIFGDMPIYVAMDSADTWSNPEIFWLDRSRRPVCVAGCPPDYFSETGQLWGNPLYDWEFLKKTKYNWWMNRIDLTRRLFDVTRIDHFRAFDTYYAIPYGEETAVNGQWMEGPGIDFFKTLRRSLGNVPIIAEDLGLLFPSVQKLLKKTGYPGMKVLQFAFDSNEENDYLPHHFDNHCVVYTGTHDNNTVNGWLEQASRKDRKFAVDYCRLTKREGYHWGMIRTALSSVSDLAIAQMQDVLGLGAESRMNLPSTLGGNWQWRMAPDALTPELAGKLRYYTALYGPPAEKNSGRIRKDAWRRLLLDGCSPADRRRRGIQPGVSFDFS